jgi:hypothetical protein
LEQYIGVAMTIVLLIVMVIRSNSTNKCITKIEYAPCKVLYICSDCKVATSEENLISRTVDISDQEGDRLWGKKTVKECKCGCSWFVKVNVIKEEYVNMG